MLIWIVLLFLLQNFSIPVNNPESIIDARVLKAALVKPAKILVLEKIFIFILLFCCMSTNHNYRRCWLVKLEVVCYFCQSQVFI